MNTLIKAPFDWSIPPPPFLFSLKETRLSPRSIFECCASLGNHGYIPVSNPCSFFAVHTRSRHRFTLESHNPMLFLLLDTPHRIIPIPSPLYCYWNFFSQKVIKHICISFTFFLSFNTQLFQLLNFTFSCTLIAFINGLFFARRVKNYDSSAARNLQDPSTVVSFFMSFPE